jgi:hypothetical protein
MIVVDKDPAAIQYIPQIEETEEVALLNKITVDANIKSVRRPACCSVQINFQIHSQRITICMAFRKHGNVDIISLSFADN